MKVENGINQLNQEAVNLLLAFFNDGSASSYIKPLMKLRQDFFDSGTFEDCSETEVSNVVNYVDTISSLIMELQEQVNKIKAAQAFLYKPEN